jgi:hypothetical protein
MMKKTIPCLLLVCSLTAYGQNFPKGIKYLGGPGFPDIEDVRDSWDNSPNATDKEITFSFKKNLIPTETISTGSVTRLTYGQATTRRVGKWVAVGVILAPIALVGIFHKSRQHRILVEWTDEQQREWGLLMQAHKDQFVGLLNALSFRTRKPIYADKDERDWLFQNGVKAEPDTAKDDPTEKSGPIAKPQASEVAQAAKTPEEPAAPPPEQTPPTLNRDSKQVEVVSRAESLPTDIFYIDCGNKSGDVPFSTYISGPKKVACGEEIMVLGVSGEWTRIRTRANVEGNVSSRFVGKRSQ